MSVPTDRRLVTRRAAARAIAAAALAALGVPRALVAHPFGATPPNAGFAGLRLRLGVVRAPSERSAGGDAANGILLGAEEARRGASLLGRELVVREGTIDELLDEGVDVLLGGAAADDGCALADAGRRAPVVWLELGCRAGAAPAAPNVFLVAPGAETRRLAAARAATPGEVAVWHPALERFGAGQLNSRYLARFGEPMRSAAWAGWMAVKIAWESSLRRDAADGETLAAFLLSPRARFDGHKGRALRFDPTTRELRQPLYIVRESGEATSIEEIAPPATAGGVGP
jgi:hypothetical protein